MSGVCFLWACISGEVIFGKPPWSASCCIVITCLHLPLLPTRYQSIHLPGARSGFSTPLNCSDSREAFLAHFEGTGFPFGTLYFPSQYLSQFVFYIMAVFGDYFSEYVFFHISQTRGVKDCLSLSSYSPSTLSWLSINNVWIGWVFSWKN